MLRLHRSKSWVSTGNYITLLLLRHRTSSSVKRKGSLYYILADHVQWVLCRIVGEHLPITLRQCLTYFLFRLSCNHYTIISSDWAEWKSSQNHVFWDVQYTHLQHLCKCMNGKEDHFSSSLMFSRLSNLLTYNISANT